MLGWTGHPEDSRAEGPSPGGRLQRGFGKGWIRRALTAPVGQPTALMASGGGDGGWRTWGLSGEGGHWGRTCKAV